MELLDRVLRAGFGDNDQPYKPHAKKLRRMDRKRMRSGARQYGRTYYVPAATKRRWAFIGVGLVLMCSSIMFGFYVWVVHALGLI